ncbi:MAG TPA: ABC transporter permease, partial [Thermoanaerobaculia bacterium]
MAEGTMEALRGSHSLQIGLLQAAIVTAVALAVMLVARRQSIHLERETVVALARGAVQIVAVGLVLGLLLRQE